MSNYNDKPIDEWLIGDWVDAMASLDSGRFLKRRRLAERAGIEVPAFCYRNTKPRITFKFSGDDEHYRFYRIQDNERLIKFNQEVIAWSKKVEQELKMNAPRQAIKIPRSMNEMSRKRTKRLSSLFNSSANVYGETLSESITSTVRYDEKYRAEAVNVGFNFSRHGIHLHYGAGKGVGGFKGSKWTDRYGRLKTTNQYSLGNMGSPDSGRTPVDWFNPVLKRNIEQLANIAVDYCADVTVNVSRLYLPY